jgi:hypothetical protein
MKKSIFIACLFSISAFASSEDSKIANAIKRIEIGVEIGKMIGADQALRFGSTKANMDGIPWEEISKHPMFLRKLAKVDPQNARRVKAMVKKYGWPLISEFGEHTAHDAWLLVQHMDADVHFQEEILSKMTALLPEEECAKPDYALLYDRVQVNSGKSQLYGSQGQCVGHDHLWKPKPISNPDTVDQRRAEMGLQSMAEYEQLFKDKCP